MVVAFISPAHELLVTTLGIGPVGWLLMKPTTPIVFKGQNHKSLIGDCDTATVSDRLRNLHIGCAICDFLRENKELQLEQELDRQSNSKIGAT
jgi:hypothetical protein